MVDLAFASDGFVDDSKARRPYQRMRSRGRPCPADASMRENSADTTVVCCKLSSMLALYAQTTDGGFLCTA